LSWAIRPLGFASYINYTGATDADIIRQYWPHHLVQPEWVSDDPSRLMNWHFTEATVRVALVGLLWIGFVGTFGRGVVFTPFWRRREKPNHGLHWTAR